MKKWIIGIVVVVLVVVVLAAVAGALSENETDQPAVSETSTPSIDSQARLERWEGVHERWERVDRYHELVAKVQEGGVTVPEALVFCDMTPQLIEHMREIQDYVAEYRLAEPEFVADNPTVTNLEDVAARAEGELELALAEC